jgi:hypothetical protein
MDLQEQIRRVLKEYWVKPKQDNTRAEKRINRIMSQKFPWWKNITIEEFSHSGISPHSLTLYGTIEVDEEWAEERWKEVYDYSPFPGKEEYIRFEHLLTRDFEKELSDFMGILLSAVTTYSPIDKVRIGELEVKLV